jgi:hypothetical protein
MADQAAVDKVLAGENDCQKMDLSGANFAGMNLSRRNFYSADLSGADLSGADLRWCDFNYTDLRGAKIEGADFFSSSIKTARIDSPKKTTTDLLAAIQAVIAGVKGHKSLRGPSVTVYEIPGCTIVQGKPGTSAYTLVFDAEDADKPKSDAAEKVFSYPSLKRYGDWPFRIKMDDPESELVEPIADIQLGEE